MERRTVLAALSLAAIVAAASAGAAEKRLSDAELVGDPAAGHAVAADICSECHSVEGRAPSPVEDAPTFRELAGQAGITATALQVWLTTFHPDRTMPAIVLSDAERRDVIAYILSLRDR
jgi:mono/diheme cytochrome c family protein